MVHDRLIGISSDDVIIPTTEKKLNSVASVLQPRDRRLSAKKWIGTTYELLTYIADNFFLLVAYYVKLILGYKRDI
jgi:hypothetical protein